MRRSFRDMQEQMREHSDAAHGQTQYNTNTASKKPANGKVGDYIDFEEVKD